MNREVSASTPARIGLLGNPSDGYFGSCISLPVYNWEATVTISTSEGGEEKHILPDDKGLRRIMEPTVKVFEERFKTEMRPFKVDVTTTIPRQVGLSGSSAIETAFMRALMEWNGIPDKALHPRQLAELVLSIERDELGMVAGLQDRLPQAYLKMLHMDFKERLMKERGFGEYTEMDPENLPRLWVAHSSMGDDSGEVHSNIAERWERGDLEMKKIIRLLKECADEGREAIAAKDHLALACLMDTNFDLRTELFGAEALGETWEAVMLARSLGSCAKQCGSGGSIVGIIPNQAFESTAARRFQKIGWTYHGDVVVVP